MSEEKKLIKKLQKKKKKQQKTKKHLEKQLNENQDAVNISNQRTDKIPVIAIDNYTNTLKEYDSIYPTSKDLQLIPV